MTFQANKDVFMKDMTWPEIKQRLEETDIALFPTGQTEQHGHHLPIDTDNYICTGIALRVAEATAGTAKPIVAPTIPFGYSDTPYFRDHHGTFSLDPTTLTNVYYELSLSLIRMGFKKIVYVNGHYPNPPFIEEAMRRLTKETGVFVAMCNFFVLPAQEIAIILEELGKPPVWGHACLAETSVSEVFGAEVREDRLKGYIPTNAPKELEDYMPFPPPGISLAAVEYYPTAACWWGGEEGPGPMGDPNGHSKELGERIIKATADPIIQLVNNIKDMEVELNPWFLEQEKTRG